jgi:hypothetical protein
VADAQYIIDIAAEMPNGTATIAELEALSSKLTGAGTRSDSFQNAIKRLSSELDGAKAAADAANAALAQGSSEYSILEREAVRAGKALEKAQAGKHVPLDVYRQAQQANAALSAYEGKLKGLEAASKSAGGEQAKLAGALEKVRKLAAHVDQRNAALNQRYEKMGQVVSFLPGPLGRLGGSLVRGAKASNELSVAMGASSASMIVTGVVAAVAAAAVLAVTVAMVAGAVAAASYALSQGDAARSAGLSREAFSALNPELAAAAASFDTVRAATEAGDAELMSLSKSLKDAKVSAADMPAALLAAAQAERALGKGGASEFVEKIKEGSLTVDQFAQDVEAKFGGIVAAQMRGLTAQGLRFDRLWSKLFDGINIEPVLDAVSVIVGMFDKTNPLAQAFGDAITNAFSLVEDYALPAAYAVEAFALGVAISFTKAYLAVKPFLGGIGDITGILPEITTLGKLAGYAFLALGAGFAVVAVIGGVLLGALGLAVTLFSAATAAVFALGYALGAGLAWAIETTLGLLSAVGTAIAGWYSSMFDMGKNLLLGLVDGIVSVASAVVGAVTSAVTGAIDAAKDLLGIASPSKVFMQIGEHTAEGFVEGVDNGADDAQGSMAALVDAEAKENAKRGVSNTASSSAPAAGSSSSSSKTIDLSGAVFTFHGVKDADTARDKFAEALTALLEGDADSLTGAPA